MAQQILSSISDSSLDNTYLIEKKFEVMLENANKKVMGEILKIRESLNSLQDDVNKLKTSHAEDSGAGIRRHAVATPSGNTGNRENGIVRPGYDDINPKDVAVEKMFYFGNKR